MPVPGLIDHLQIWGIRSPRFWVSLIQRATGKLRWTPISRPQVSFDSYDQADHGQDCTVKAVLDALKVATTGRRDGQTIYYFGAIVDDSNRDLDGLTVRQHVVDLREDVGCRIVVQQSEADATKGA